jgi:hypothetical protein
LGGGGGYPSLVCFRLLQVSIPHSKYIYLRVKGTDRETACDLDNQTLLGFATLGIATQIGRLLFVAHQPRWKRDVQ